MIFLDWNGKEHSLPKGRKFRWRPSAYALVIENEKILIVKPNFGRWCLPGGEINLGEKITDGIKREVLEETGYEIIFEDEHPIYFKDNFFYAPDIDEYYQSLIMVFKAKINGNKKDKMKFDNEEIKEVKWIN